MKFLYKKEKKLSQSRLIDKIDKNIVDSRKNKNFYHKTKTCEVFLMLIYSLFGITKIFCCLSNSKRKYYDNLKIDFTKRLSIEYIVPSLILNSKFQELFLSKEQLSILNNNNNLI